MILWLAASCMVLRLEAAAQQLNLEFLAELLLQTLVICSCSTLNLVCMHDLAQIEFLIPFFSTSRERRGFIRIRKLRFILEFKFFSMYGCVYEPTTS